MKQPLHRTCEVCKKSFSQENLYPLELVRSSVFHLIEQDHPEADRSGHICFPDLQFYQIERSRDLVEMEVGELSQVEEEVVHSIDTHEILTGNINEEYEDSLTLGQRVADAVSSFGGSWPFIFMFFSFLLGWMIFNSLILLKDSYDPYPYILLNLVLSCLAAIQAPIIMMSQNRRAMKDRIEAENDYKINLKAELQIRHLNSKIDQLNKHHWQRMIELQETQLEIMQTLMTLKDRFQEKK